MRPGPKLSSRKAEYIQRLGIRPAFVKNWLKEPLMDLLDRCADDDARRILINSMGYRAGRPRSVVVPCALRVKPAEAPDLAYWLAHMGASDDDWIYPRGRPAPQITRSYSTPRKPVVSETLAVAEEPYGYEPRSWRLMRLSERIGRRA